MHSGHPVAAPSAARQVGHILADRNDFQGAATAFRYAIDSGD